MAKLKRIIIKMIKIEKMIIKQRLAKKLTAGLLNWSVQASRMSSVEAGSTWSPLETTLPRIGGRGFDGSIAATLAEGVIGWRVPRRQTASISV